MDPNANLESQLQLARELLHICEAQESIDANESPDLLDVSSLAEQVIAMDAWITNGGFLPQSWTRNQTLADWALARIEGVNDEQGHGMNPEQIKGEADALTNALARAADAYLAHSFDPGEPS